MDLESYSQKFKMSELRKHLLAVEENRLASNTDISIRDLDIELKRIIDDAQSSIQ